MQMCGEVEYTPPSIEDSWGSSKQSAKWVADSDEVIEPLTHSIQRALLLLALSFSYYYVISPNVGERNGERKRKRKYGKKRRKGRKCLKRRKERRKRRIE